MGVSPPTSSVIVERHYPTAQVLSQFAPPSLMRCSYAFLQIKSWSTFLFAFRSFSKLSAKLQLLSFLIFPTGPRLHRRQKLIQNAHQHVPCTLHQSGGLTTNSRISQNDLLSLFKLLLFLKLKHMQQSLNFQRYLIKLKCVVCGYVKMKCWCSQHLK